MRQSTSNATPKHKCRQHQASEPLVNACACLSWALASTTFELRSLQDPSRLRRHRYTPRQLHGMRERTHSCKDCQNSCPAGIGEVGRAAPDQLTALTTHTGKRQHTGKQPTKNDATVTNARQCRKKRSCFASSLRRPHPRSKIPQIEPTPPTCKCNNINSSPERLPRYHPQDRTRPSERHCDAKETLT